MRRYIFAAAVAAAPLLASTSAYAIGVQAGSQLKITVTGDYSVNGGGGLGLGSVLTLSEAFVAGISQTNEDGIDLDGLVRFSDVGVDGPFTLGNGSANSDVVLSFITEGGGAIFGLGESFGATFSADGLGRSSLIGLGTLSNGDDEPGSFSFATTSSDSSGTFQLTVAVPPEVELPTPDPSPIPLPAAAWMLLVGLGSLFAVRRMRKA